MSEILQLNSVNQEMVVARCLELLSRTGSVLLLPTETVYGLCCAADDAQACELIYEMKKRDGRKPLQLLVDDVSRLDHHQIESFPALERVCQAFCPGPITIVVDGAEGTVGFRIPDHPFMVSLLKQYQRPLAATSANLSGEPACLTVDHALTVLAQSPCLAVDGGAISADSLASTVISLTPDSWQILREGPISCEQIRQVLESR